VDFLNNLLCGFAADFRFAVYLSYYYSIFFWMHVLESLYFLLMVCLRLFKHSKENVKALKAVGNRAFTFASSSFSIKPTLIE